jgi:2-polyprenyl-3-methyl-5-hydroxy-6-metoxy-1,4-benzoquinol methylase
MVDTPYTGAFFAFHRSLVDVGCGIGTWLAEFEAAGIADVTGVDGDYVDRARLLIDRARFEPRDLSRPFELDRKFDLAMSLEVAEHLPPNRPTDS